MGTEAERNSGAHAQKGRVAAEGREGAATAAATGNVAVKEEDCCFIYETIDRIAKIVKNVEETGRLLRGNVYGDVRCQKHHLLRWWCLGAAQPRRRPCGLVTPYGP